MLISRTLSRSALGAVCALALTLPVFAAPRSIAIKATDDLKYSVNKIEAKPGEELEVVLTGVSAMPKDSMAHNFVLLDPSVNVNAFTSAAVAARNTGYIPAKFKAKILASTGLAGGGETVKVTFKAPTTPGTYTYVCTFPAHFAGGMVGQLIVK